MARVRGNIADFCGPHRLPSRITSGSVKFILVAPPQTSCVPHDRATGRTVPGVYDVDVLEDGTFRADVVSNDHIHPVGTAYHVAFLVPNVSIVPGHYVFEGDGIVDLARLERVTSDHQRRAHEASLPPPPPEAKKAPECFLVKTEVINAWDLQGRLNFELHAHYSDGTHECVGSYLHFALLDAARQGLISKFRPGPGRWRGGVK